MYTEDGKFLIEGRCYLVNDAGLLEEKRNFESC